MNPTKTFTKLFALFLMVVAIPLSSLAATTPASIGTIESTSPTNASITITNADGVSRVVKAGDPIYPGETIATADGVSLVIKTKDGVKLAVTGNSSMTLNTDGATVNNGTVRVSTVDATISGGYAVTTKDSTTVVNGVSDILVGDLATAVVMQVGSANVTATNCSANCNNQKIVIPGMAVVAVNTKPLSDQVTATAISMSLIQKQGKGTLADATGAGEILLSTAPGAVSP